jgi:low affinity Fe/Cu permease
MALQRPRVRRSGFDRFAETASDFVSRGSFFAISVLLVVLWMPTIWLFGSVDTWQLVINTAVSVLAFLLVALLQNSERRNDRAIHEKLDALALGLADLMEHGSSGDAAALEDKVAKLRSSVGREREV